MQAYCIKNSVYGKWLAVNHFCQTDNIRSHRVHASHAVNLLLMQDAHTAVSHFMGH